VQLKGNLKTVLADKLVPTQLKQLYKSYDIIGNIAVLRVPESLENHIEVIAKAIMNTHKEVKSVWRQCSSVSGDYRLRKLEHVIGKKTTQTRYKEHGCIYKTDLKKTYFSPRLSYERLRIAKLVQTNETVLNMFAGVGCYSIAIAKHSTPKNVYSVDVNPVAIKYHIENVSLNHVENVVVPILGDAKTVTETKLQKVADRVLMPLPELAYDYLEAALSCLKPEGGRIHYYDFEYAKREENPVRKTETKVSQKLEKMCTNFEVKFGRIVRSIGPRWYQIVLDLQITN
jgi:tRNA (guanine37-N1)-methyltransferase